MVIQGLGVDESNAYSKEPLGSGIANDSGGPEGHRHASRQDTAAHLRLRSQFGIGFRV